MKYIIIALFLIGCTQTPLDTIPTDNKNFNVDLLFTNDGCKVYRFFDQGRNHYYTNCTETISNQNCGKSCNYTENIGDK